MNTAHPNCTQTLQERLSDPRTTEALNHLLDQVGVIERAVALLEQAMNQGPNLVSMVTDTVDEAFRDAARSGTDLEEHGRNALLLLQKLTEPRTVKVLSALLDRIDRLEQVVMLADQLPGMVAMATDTLDDFYRKASESGIEVEEVIRQGGKAVRKFSTLMTSEEFDTLMESGVLEPRAVRVVGGAAHALVASQEEYPSQVNLFGLFRAMKDPDVQRTIGFFVHFAKQFGQALDGQVVSKQTV